MIFDLLNIIISYCIDDIVKLKFYQLYSDKIIEINLNTKYSNPDLDLSKFTKLKKLILPNYIF